MQHSTLHVRVLEAPSSPNDLLAFAFLSSPHNQWALIDPHWCSYDSKYPPFDTNGGANSTSKCNSRLQIRLLSEVRQKPPVAV